MRYKRKCPRCLIEFETNIGNKMFCTYECRQSYGDLKVCKGNELFKKSERDQEIWRELHEM